MKIINFFHSAWKYFWAALGLKMRAKLVIIFVLIQIIPLFLFAYATWRQTSSLADTLEQRMQRLALNTNKTLTETGNIAVSDAVRALNDQATENIEYLTTDTAMRLAEFLYERDNDILFAATLRRDQDDYRRYVTRLKGKLLKQQKWVLASDGQSWIPEETPPQSSPAVSSNEENDRQFHYRSPYAFAYENRPLYAEITFVDLEGNEKLKVTTSPQMSLRLKNISQRGNTYVRAENYWDDLQKLKPGEIYVSEVIGAYVPSRVIGTYTPEKAAEAAEEFAPQRSAYAGKENPLGKRFKGIVRWATPVVEAGKITGYVTMALDHDHIMEFTAHIVPTDERYTEIPNAHEGNYAFAWDHKGRNIAHPRHHSIVGYDPETGDPQVPWLEEGVYRAWLASGESYADFIRDYPVFEGQSSRKKPAEELTEKGLVGLDGRYLNFAPQCTGWLDLTREGGAGSFLILQSGMAKLTTAAAIPYYTGQYGASKRGFGFVTVGAELDDFYRPARETEQVLDKLLAASEKEIIQAAGETEKAIQDNLLKVTRQFSAFIAVMITVVVLIALWMAAVFTRSITRLINGISRFRSGERHFRFNEPVKDELGILADSFDEMADSVAAGVDGLEKAVEEANRANASKGKFLARMSHEIRTPMNAIIGLTNIVKKRLSADCVNLQETQNHMRQIENSAQHLLGLLNDILDLSKIEAGKIELTEENVDLFKLMNTVSSIIRPRCEEKNILLETVFEVSSPAFFVTDPLRLRQVLINLLGNSVKFTPECGKIEFHVIQKKGKDAPAAENAAHVPEKALVEFSVVDSGIGISTEALANLFHPFEQGGAQITKHYGGTGLGLTISRNIVQLLGGDITVKSELGKGSTFSFALRFPRGVTENEEDGAFTVSGSFEGKRALLVDDVAVNRMITMELLSDTGLSIDEADDGLAAVKMFEESPVGGYDIIFMDVQMPGMDGYEAASAIRMMDRPDAKTVPIVALTANAFKEDADKALQCGMNAHLSKPIEADKILEVAARFLNSWGAHRPAGS